MGDLSPHFSRYEFDSRDGKRANPSPKLIEMLERLRVICGNKPLRIVSGYRSPEHNKAVGGAPQSRHMANDAADIEPGYATVEQARRAGANGIGRKGKWATHVDVRPGRHAEWSY